MYAIKIIIFVTEKFINHAVLHLHFTNAFTEEDNQSDLVNSALTKRQLKKY